MGPTGLKFASAFCVEDVVTAALPKGLTVAEPVPEPAAMPDALGDVPLRLMVMLLVVCAEVEQMRKSAPTSKK